MAAAPQPRAPAVRGEFLLCACQGGAERPLQVWLTTALPGGRSGAWRRGLVTIRLPEGTDPPDDFFPDVVFARTVEIGRAHV